ncbi:MAG: GerW family sporulation protein [Eubacteriales bacterium]|nr:GerW family sporulation protein [Eubacteriales bacterium]
MQQHPIDNMMQTTMDSIRGMVDVNTVVGTPVLGTRGTTIIPISKVSFGFIAGGGEYDPQKAHAEKFPFAGGSGAGVSVQPVGFLVVGEHSVKVLPAQTSGAMERMVDLIPQIMEDLKDMEQKDQKKASYPKKGAKQAAAGESGVSAVELPLEDELEQ